MALIVGLNLAKTGRAQLSQQVAELDNVSGFEKGVEKVEKENL